MKITISAPIQVAESSDDDLDPVTDKGRLEALDGTAYRDESFCEYLDEGPFAGVILSDDGIVLRFDATADQLRYVTEYHADKALSDEQIALLRDHTIDLWREGIGVNFAQLTISDQHRLVVLGDDQVGKVGTTVEIEQ